jgi:hypothetical protein
MEYLSYNINIRSSGLVCCAQRLAAQLLGCLRFEFTILAGNLKTYIGVRSLSLGQVSCSRVLGIDNLFDPS